MLIKKFQAESMPEALKMVKAEFGLDAMILNSREERRKGLLGLFRKPYVEVTAGIGRQAAERGTPEAPVAETPATTRDEFRNAMLEPLAREIRQLKEKVDVLFDKEPSGIKRARSVTGEGSQVPAETHGTGPAVIDEPEVFAKVDWGSADPGDAMPAPDPDPPMVKGARKRTGAKQAMLGAFAAELRENGVDTEVAGTLLERIASRIGRKRQQSDMGKGLEEALESLVDFTEVTGNEEQRVIALVGPTGVGKTTTIAKIAVAAAKHGKKVAILSADKLKPGDSELLKSCTGSADILIDSAMTPQKLGKALRNLRGRDIVLIDTGGISPNDREGMEHLEKLLTASPLIEKHLCLSSTTRDRELAETIRRFGRYAIDRLVFTRLDESETFGSINNVLLRSNLPPSVLTDGQKVSGNIEIATAGRLAELAMGGR